MTSRMIAKYCCTSEVRWKLNLKTAPSPMIVSTLHSLTYQGHVFAVYHNRGGIRVRIRREFSSTLLTGHNGLYLTRRSWDVRYVNHRPIVLDQNWTPDYCAPARQSRGVNLQNLIPLKYVRQSQKQTVHSHVKMALVNVCV